MQVRRKSPIRSISAIILTTIAVSTTACGEATDGTQAQSSKGEAITKAFAKSLPHKPVQKVAQSDMPGLYEVTLSRGETVYSTEDGKYFVAGTLYENTENGAQDVQERNQRPIRAERLAKIDTDDMIVFGAVGKTRGALYVFTDVDCGYCQKLHREVPALNKAGIEVRYLAFPRGGERSRALSKMISAWCSDDRKKAMNTLKAGISIPAKSCSPNAVMDQHRLGLSLGVTGTPSIFLEDGRNIPGYRKAAALIDAVVK